MPINKNKLLLQFIALMISIFMWVILTDSMNPYTSITTQIPIQIVKISTNSNIERTYSIAQTNARVTYKVREKQKQNISTNDFYAYIKVDDSDKSGNRSINLEYINKESLIDVKIDPEFTYLNVDNLGQKRYSVSYTPIGELSSQDYAIGFVDLSPSEIYLKAASTVLENIEKVKIDIPLTGQSDTFSGKAELKYFDKNDNEIKNLPDEIEKHNIEYRVVVYGTKTVPLNIGITGNVARGHSYAGATSKPSNIVITTSKETLSKIDTIDLPDIDITDIDENKEYKFKISDILPANVRSVNATNEIVVTVMVNNISRDDDPPPAIRDSMSKVSTSSNVIITRRDDRNINIHPIPFNNNVENEE